MRIYLYKGGSRLVGKSGVGRAIEHQEQMLHRTGIHTTCAWSQAADAVHLNTVFPDSVLVALRARLRGRKVIYYGHSTMEDFRNSFKGSNLVAPLFRRWITFCYGLGDVVLTPTRYSKELLESYGVHRPIHAISNGVDTRFFAPDEDARARFRQRWKLAEEQPVVVSVGHFIQRKGLLEYIELARRLPQVRFFWFGWTDLTLVPEEIRTAIQSAPDNLTFPGYVDRAALRDAYCGADAFVFMSHEETEGIVVLEALACGTPALLRDIPVYEGWLQDGKEVYKARETEEFQEILTRMLSGELPSLVQAGRAVAEERSLEAMGRKLQQIYHQEGIRAVESEGEKEPAAEYGLASPHLLQLLHHTSRD
jgi:1,2-diacylglycerol-3-alpha-glucose alpha-1,2-glucosyltransferase